MNKKGKKIIIFIIIFILVVLFTNILFRFVLPVRPMVLISRNMEPTYEKWDVIFSQRTNNYEAGDVIVYTTALNPSVVRITGLNDDGTLSAKGDANRVPVVISGMDETHIKKEEIIGEVVFAAKWFIFYPILFIIEIIISLLLTQLVYPKLERQADASR